MVSRALSWPEATSGAHLGQETSCTSRTQSRTMKPRIVNRVGHDQMNMLRGPGVARLVVVARDRPARGDAAVVAHAGDRRFEVIAADVVEVHVDAVGCGGGRAACRTLAVAVVECGIEAELVASGCATFAAEPALPIDEAAALLGELAGDAADGAGRAGDEHAIAGLDLDELEADPGGQPRHAEHAEVARERRDAAHRRRGDRWPGATK